MQPLDHELHTALDRVLHGISQQDLAARAAALSDRYREKRVTDVAVGMVDRLDCLAYAASRMPATAAAVGSVLADVEATIPAGRSRTHVDLGGGTGAAAWAAVAVWPDIKTTTIERQVTAVGIGRELMRGVPSLAAARSAWITQDVRSWHPKDVDLVTMGYLLVELDPGSRRDLVLRAASRAGTVVIVEPGTPAGHECILQARSELLSAGLVIAAPCPHQGLCPLQAGPAWCHFPVRVRRSQRHQALKGGARDYEEEKFSFVVATRLPFRATTTRVIGQPRQAKRRVILDLCTPGGRQWEVVAKSASRYREARAAEWGDQW